MTNQAKIISIFVASLLLVSCSSESNSVKFASKEEAFLAQVDFLKESDDIVVVTSPTDQEIEAVIKEVGGNDEEFYWSPDDL